VPQKVITFCCTSSLSAYLFLQAINLIVTYSSRATPSTASLFDRFPGSPTFVFALSSNCRSLALAATHHQRHSLPCGTAHHQCPSLPCGTAHHQCPSLPCGTEHRYCRVMRYATIPQRRQTPHYNTAAGQHGSIPCRGTTLRRGTCAALICALLYRRTSAMCSALPKRDLTAPLLRLSALCNTHRHAKRNATTALPNATVALQVGASPRHCRIIQRSSLTS